MFRLELNKITFPSSYLKGVGNGALRSKNERVELAMRIMKYREIARLMAANPLEMQRILELVADLEKKLREIDE